MDEENIDDDELEEGFLFGVENQVTQRFRKKVTELAETITEQAETITEQAETITKKDKVIAEKDEALAEKDEALAKTEREKTEQAMIIAGLKKRLGGDE